MLSVAELAAMIDHSIIDPYATLDDMKAGVELALARRTACFVTQPFRVKEAARLLDGTGMPLQTFVGYPHGSDVTAVKVLQARTALDDGVNELDMVINFGAFLSGDLAYVHDDVAAVVEAARPYGVTVKAIIEVFYLDHEQVRQAALTAEAAGVGFIKTSTGTRPDTTEDVEAKVRVLREVLKPETTVKASGGVYSIDAVMAYHRAGARRFGASETAKILDDYAALVAAGRGLD